MASKTSSTLRLKVLRQYKILLHIGKDYPMNYNHFRKNVKSEFMKNKDVADENQIRKLLLRAKYMEKELLAVIKFKKYRFLKRNYSHDNIADSFTDLNKKS